MSDVIVNNQCQLTTWEVVEKSGDSPPIYPGHELTVSRSALTDPNILPIKLVSGKADSNYTYTIVKDPVKFKLTNGQFNIPLPPDDPLSPTNVSIGDGQGEI